MNDACPLISIVIPVYNVEHLVKDCIASILAQTYPHFEVILVNDGSTDGSGAVLDAAAATDSRLQVVHLTNGGPSRARNTGIKMAKGQFVMFVDADDTIRADTLAVLAACQAVSDADLTVASYSKVFEGKHPVGDDGGVFEDTVFDGVSLYAYVRQYIKLPHIYVLFSHCWGRLFRTSILQGGVLFNENFNQLEDVDLNFRFLMLTTKVA